MGPKTKKRVLIVDDNLESAEAAKDLLEGEGHQVLMATEPVAALDIARRFQPEICVLDIELPVMDGYQLSGHLRDVLAARPCVLIAVTGYGQEHDRYRSRAAGFDHHLVKPIDSDRLIQIVAES